jgi:Protein of unknown function (DUF3592)
MDGVSMDAGVSIPNSWTPPYELTRALPREVKMTATGIMASIVALMMIVASIAMTLAMEKAAKRQAANAAALESSGRDIQAQVKQLWHAGKSSTPMVSYEFTFQGASYSGQAYAPQQIWQDLREGGPIPVRYLPSNPQISHPLAWARQLQPFWAPLPLFTVLFLSGAVLLWMVRRQGALLANGTPARATVTKTYRTKGGWTVRYEFRTTSGEVRKGAGNMARKIEPGTTICILYNPENPRRNAPYPIPQYRVVEY